MPVPSVITDLSTVAASNYPAGTDSPSTLDDVQRAHASFIAQLRDGSGFTAGALNALVTAPTAVASVNGGQLAGLRNRIINGNMGVFQRGTTAVTVTAEYGPADRWRTDVVGDTFSTTQGSFVSGDTLYDTGSAQYFTQIAVTSVANTANYCTWQQQIEDVRVLAGQTVTVSFWAKAASGTPSIAVEIVQVFGTGGSPSANVTGTGQAQALTTTWTKYSKTFTVPSINSKTIGTDPNTSATVINFWLDAGATYNTRANSIGQVSKTVGIAQVQTEVGSVATTFEQRPYGLELALCQRYYFRVGPGLGNGFTWPATSGWADSTTSAQLMMPFPAPMRIAPTALEQSGTAANYAVRYAGGSATDCSAVPTFGNATVNGALFVFTVAAVLTTGQAIAARTGSASGNSAYLGWSAEL